MMLVKVGTDAPRRRFRLDSGNVAVGPHQISGIGAQTGPRHLSLPGKDVQQQLSCGTDAPEVPGCLTIYMDLPVKRSQRCEVVRIRYLHPWKPVPTPNRTEMALAQCAPAVIHIRLRDGPIQLSKRWPECKQ